MSTAELERLLETALHEADSARVDVAAGRRRLVGRRDERTRNVRRLVVALVVAFALLATVGAAVVLWIRGAADEPPPIHRPHVVTFSPSGLPVGLLKGLTVVDSDSSTFRLLVRRNGTGQFQYGDGGHSVVGPMNVGIQTAGPEEAQISYVNSICTRPQVLTLRFTVTRATVTILQVSTPASCGFPRSAVERMTGMVMDVLPSPPGGLGSEGGGDN